MTRSKQREWSVSRGLVVLLAVVLLVGSVLAGCGGTAKDTAEWHFDQGNKLYSQGRYNEAIEEYTWAIELDPNSTEAYGNRGNAYKLQGMKAEALADFEKVITLTDNPQWIQMARQQIGELSE